MAKRPSKRNAKEESGLLSALRFISVAQHDTGTVYQTHCRLTSDGYAVANDGVLAAGHPTKEEMMTVCPQTNRLIAALERVAGAMSLTMLDTKQLVVKSDRFRALVSCVGDGDLTYVAPDACQWPLTDTFKAAANVASTYSTEGAQTVMQAAIITRDGSLIGTDGRAIVECWHGNPTPPGLVIPVTFVKALAKVTSPISGFGFSPSSLTVWFESGAWLKTQLYLEPFPDVDRVLAETNDAKPVDLGADIVEGVRNVAAFTEGTSVWLGDGKVRSHADELQGAAYDAPTAVISVQLNHKHFLALADSIKRIDFVSNGRMVPFFGDNIRGAFAKFTG